MCLLKTDKTFDLRWCFLNKATNSLRCKLIGCKYTMFSLLQISKHFCINATTHNVHLVNTNTVMVRVSLLLHRI